MMNMARHKFSRLSNERAQSLSEYAILIGIIIAVLVSVQPFLKGRVQAVVKDTVEQYGDPYYTGNPVDIFHGEITISNSTSQRDTEAVVSSLGYGTETTNSTTISQSTYRQEAEEVIE